MAKAFFYCCEGLFFFFFLLVWYLVCMRRISSVYAFIHRYIHRYMVVYHAYRFLSLVSTTGYMYSVGDKKKDPFLP